MKKNRPKQRSGSIQLLSGAQKSYLLWNYLQYLGSEWQQVCYNCHVIRGIFCIIVTRFVLCNITTIVLITRFRTKLHIFHFPGLLLSTFFCTSNRWGCRHYVFGLFVCLCICTCMRLCVWCQERGIFELTCCRVLLPRWHAECGWRCQNSNWLE